MALDINLRTLKKSPQSLISPQPFLRERGEMHFTVMSWHYANAPSTVHKEHLSRAKDLHYIKKLLNKY